VITTVPGIRTMRELEALLAFDAADQDYSAIASLTPEAVAGTCVYCGHCRPCPAGKGCTERKTSWRDGEKRWEFNG
jgi:predicted aldo/keto reductase-like oxidoreductase